MRKLLFLILLLSFVPVNVCALDIEAPEVPDSASGIMPDDTHSFSSALGELIQNVLSELYPDVSEAIHISISATVIVLICSVLQNFQGSSKKIIIITAASTIIAVLFKNTNTMIRLAAETITEMSEYGKLLFPVLVTATIAQGGTASSAALYTGTVMFDLLLTNLIAKVLVPSVYMFLALVVANSTVGDNALKMLRDLVKGIVSWTLKTLLTVFTTYMSITGVVSGTTDAVALKATKITLSTAVPVIGGILSDASEAILVSTGLAKNAAGIYGLLAVAAIFLKPFLKIWVHCSILKLTAALCSLFGCKPLTSMIEDFACAMSLLLAMTGSVCLLLLISTICFLKGVG